MKLLVYDDNHSDCQRLSDLLLSVCGSQNVQIVTSESYEEAVSLLNNDFSAAFLDIKLDRNRNGILFAEKLRSVSKDVKIIFVTAYIQYCEMIFRTDPSGFIVKPLTYEKVKRAVDFLQNQRERQKAIVIQNKSEIIRLLPADISYIAIMKRKLAVFDRNCTLKYLLSMRIDDIEKLLPHNFVRCHYSYIVNMEYAQQIQQYCFVLPHGKVDIAQKRYMAVRRQYLQFLEEDML